MLSSIYTSYKIELLVFLTNLYELFEYGLHLCSIIQTLSPPHPQAQARRTKSCKVMISGRDMLHCNIACVILDRFSDLKKQHTKKAGKVGHGNRLDGQSSLC